MNAVPAHAHCGTHPAAPAIDVCARCGRFVCGRCVNAIAGEVRCEPCVALRARPVEEPFPPSLRRNLLLGAIGLLFPPALIVALVLSHPRFQPPAERWSANAELINQVLRWAAVLALLGWLYFGLRWLAYAPSLQR